MSMTSYAQNREDVRLARAFRGQSRGFYIDVGAHDPVALSITKHFYDLGWHGLNIEAATGFAERLKAARPRDTTLNVGVSDAEGSLTFFEAAKSNASGLSTFSPEEAAAHRKSGFQFIERQVPTKTLKALCQTHVTGAIDFMSIDVEGHERQVLQGADFTAYRPKILVIEATRPLTQEPSHHEWEPILLQARYEFAVFDGLNRFYVAEEWRHLKAVLETAPNPFDNFVPYEFQQKIVELERELASFRASKRVTDVAASIIGKAVSLLVPRPKA